MPMPPRVQEDLANADTERGRLDVAYSHFRATAKRHVDSLGPGYEQKVAEREAAYRRVADCMLAICEQLEASRRPR